MNNIMVIDDSKTILHVAKQIIESRLTAAKVSIYQDAFEGMEALKNEPFHVLILDIVMPEISGIEVLKRIRGNKSLDNLKVIMFTSLNDSEALSDSFKIGAYDFISKPLEENEFIARISHAINEYNQSAMIRQNFYQLTEKNNELEQLNLQLKEAHAELIHKEKLAGIGHLAAGMAHEINNPLGFLRSNVSTVMENINVLLRLYEGLKSNYISDNIDDSMKSQLVSELEDGFDYDFIVDDVEELGVDIKHGFKRIEMITEALRKFSKLDADASKELVDIGDSLETVLTMMASRFEGKVKVNKVIDPGVAVTCNKADFNMSIMALLSNAYDAIEAQKIIKEGTIEINITFEGPLVTIIIKDDGVGMRDDVTRHALDPFFTTKDVGEGVGLGLTTAYNCFVNTMKGNMIIDSKENQGTTITIELPILDEVR